ncbi:MAG: cell division protein FtsA, partial [Eubacteriales bacterium]
GHAQEEVGENEESVIHDIYVMINGTPIHLSGKKEYVFVDIFDVYEFDLTPRNGKEIITKLNQQGAKYLEAIRDGDVIELGWKDIGRA